MLWRSHSFLVVRKAKPKWNLRQSMASTLGIQRLSIASARGICKAALRTVSVMIPLTARNYYRWTYSERCPVRFKSIAFMFLLAWAAQSCASFLFVIIFVHSAIFVLYNTSAYHLCYPQKSFVSRRKAVHYCAGRCKSWLQLLGHKESRKF